MTIPFLWVPVTALACYVVLLAALLPACRKRAVGRLPGWWSALCCGPAAAC